MTATFTPSKYQQAIFDWIVNGRGNAVVNAVAGSGKSSTLVQGSKLLSSDNCLFLAFNKHIAEELEKKVPNMVCKTIHSLGNSALYREFGRLKLDENKYTKLISDEVEDLNLDYESMLKFRDTLKELVGLMQGSLVNPDDRDEIEALMAHHAIISDIDTKTIQTAVKNIFNAGVKQTTRNKTIAFIDMIWLPNVLNLPVTQYDFIFVDEAQDLSKAQLGIVMKARSKGARVLAVGDKNQAIFGFASADSESFDKIQKALNAIELPLSICYRCPSSHLDLARDIVPSIEDRPNAPKGIVTRIKESELKDYVREGDLIICRKTAPLIDTCISLIAARIPARVKGRDIGKTLNTLLKDVEKINGFSYDRFPEFLAEYANERIKKLSKKDNSESLIQSFQDRVDSVKVCYESLDANSISQLIEEINDLFSDNRASVTLSTVHRAKGLESNRVVILREEFLPLVWKNQQPWEFEQEMNLKYVALTRAKEELIFTETER